MTAARTLTEADVEAIAEALARRLAANAPLPRGKRHPRQPVTLTPDELEAAAERHARRGVPSKAR